MKKKIIIIILVIVAIIAAVFGYMVISDMQQENKLDKEFTEIADLMNFDKGIDDTTKDEINKKLDRTVTKGDYAVVEKALKSYLKDFFGNASEIMDTINDDTITNLLTVENYKSDGKDFTESKEYISSTRQKLEDCKEKLSELLTKEKAMSYIENKNLDSYYVDIYEKEFADEIDSEDHSAQDSIDELVQLLNTSEDILNLLSDNQSSWEIDGDSIVFTNEGIKNKYDELVDSIG